MEAPCCDEEDEEALALEELFSRARGTEAPAAAALRFFLLSGCNCAEDELLEELEEDEDDEEEEKALEELFGKVRGTEAPASAALRFFFLPGCNCAKEKLLEDELLEEELLEDELLDELSEKMEEAVALWIDSAAHWTERGISSRLVAEKPLALCAKEESSHASASITGVL